MTRRQVDAVRRVVRRSVGHGRQEPAAAARTTDPAPTTDPARVLSRTTSSTGSRTPSGSEPSRTAWISIAALHRPISSDGTRDRRQTRIGDRSERDPVEADDADLVGDCDVEPTKRIHQLEGELVVVADHGVRRVRGHLRGELVCAARAVAGDEHPKR